MKTKLKTIHEEAFSDNSRIIGVLLNYTEDFSYTNSLIYIFRQGNYIFFNTIIEMNDYLLYGESKFKRAYLSDKEFDEYYDLENIDGCFIDKLLWFD